MLPLLAASACSVHYIGLDIGSEFFKLSHSTPTGEVEIFTDRVDNSVLHSAAVAVKFLKPDVALSSLLDFEHIDIRYGRSAHSLLKSNSSLGLEFPTRTLGRVRSPEFHTATVTSEFGLLMLTLHHALAQMRPVEALAVAVPAFFTASQMSLVSELCRGLQLRVSALLRDFDAVFTLYGALRQPRFRASPKHVLFVDVGSMSVKCYSAVFSWESASPTRELARARQTSLEWSERSGGYHFAKAVASARGVSRRKAARALRANGGEGFADCVDDEVEALEAALQRALAEAAPAGAIDEVQLIGGASALAFVTEAVRRVTNQTIRRDFNANDAVALGAAAAAMIADGNSPYVDVAVTRLPHASLNVTCGNRSAQFCRRGEGCVELLVINDVDGVCRQFAVDGEADECPEGVPPRIANYTIAEPVHIKTGRRVTAKFAIAGPDGLVAAVRFCPEEGGEEECVDVQPEPQRPDDISGIARGYQFVSEYLRARESQEDRIRVKDALAKLNALRAKLENRRIETTREMTPGMKEELMRLTEIVEKDELEQLDADAVATWREKLEAIAKKLNVAL